MDNKEFREKLNLDELYTNKKTDFQNKLKVYQKILSRVHKKIKFASKQRNNDDYCFFVIPEFILGTPKYDVGACTAYLIKTLQENGFQTKYTYPNLLFISWKHYIPDYERQKIKDETGMKIDGFGNVIKKKRNNEMNSNDPNSSLLSLKDRSKTTKSILKKKDYKPIESYKPSGVIYSNDLIKKINNISQ